MHSHTHTRTHIYIDTRITVIHHSSVLFVYKCFHLSSWFQMIITIFYDWHMHNTHIYLYIYICHIPIHIYIHMYVCVSFIFNTVEPPYRVRFLSRPTKWPWSSFGSAAASRVPCWLWRPQVSASGRRWRRCSPEVDALEVRRFGTLEPPGWRMIIPFTLW